jgi:Domain of unknown function (DUF4336)
MAVFSNARVTYPPVDALKPVADGVWIVDSGPLKAYGLPLPLRMTVVRLASGDLWLHSPTRFDGELRRAIEQIGPIRHLVAPDIAHWTHVQEWQRACPDAMTWAAPGLRDRAQVKKSPVRLDRDLAETPPPEWTADMDQVVVPGGFGFSEVDFLHKPTRTLVLTDLVVNLEPQKLPPLARPGARLVGVVAPNGKAPVYLRMVLRMRREEARRAAARMVDWAPERVIFSHGRWFNENGAAELRRAFAWLLPSAAGPHS